MRKRPIEEVLKKHTDGLMALPGVVAIAQGESAGKLCVKVFVVEKTPEILRRIPSALGGYRVTVEETGEFRALDT